MYCCNTHTDLHVTWMLHSRENILNSTACPLTDHHLNKAKADRHGYFDGHWVKTPDFNKSDPDLDDQAKLTEVSFNLSRF